jgi:hypothetical protein
MRVVPKILLVALVALVYVGVTSVAIAAWDDTRSDGDGFTAFLAAHERALDDAQENDPSTTRVCGFPPTQPADFADPDNYDDWAALFPDEYVEVATCLNGMGFLADTDLENIEARSENAQGTTSSVGIEKRSAWLVLLWVAGLVAVVGASTWLLFRPRRLAA